MIIANVARTASNRHLVTMPPAVPADGHEHSACVIALPRFDSQLPTLCARLDHNHGRESLASEVGFRVCHVAGVFTRTRQRVQAAPF